MSFGESVSIVVCKGVRQKGFSFDGLKIPQNKISALLKNILKNKKQGRRVE